MSWFKLLCCPPVPSYIAAKLAFLPPQPSYDFMPMESLPRNHVCTKKCDHIICQRYFIVLVPNSEWELPDVERYRMEGCYAVNRYNNKIACLYIKAVPNPKYVILFSHGNAVDLGHMCSFYMGLGSVLKCNVFGYDYSGYGRSTGKPTEKVIYADIEAALDTLRDVFGVSTDKVILYGQSIGTVPTVHLASKRTCAGVVLHSPLLSGMRLMFPNTKRTWPFDAFSTIDKIDKLDKPTLVIHGTDDEIIDFTHGTTLFEKCKCAVSPLFVEGAGHSDIEMYPCYFERLHHFVNDEVGKLVPDGQKPTLLITCPSQACTPNCCESCFSGASKTSVASTESKGTANDKWGGNSNYSYAHKYSSSPMTAIEGLKPLPVE